jgi:NAD(P)-dependent dehydrogenase (short-subunit alcohol dehydrogenase family)
MSLQNKAVLSSGGGKTLGATAAVLFTAGDCKFALHCRSPSSRTEAEKMFSERPFSYPHIIRPIFEGIPCIKLPSETKV